MDVLAAMSPVTTTDPSASSMGAPGAAVDFVATLEALLDAGTPMGELTLDAEVGDAIAALLDVEVDPDELATAGWPVSLIAAALKQSTATATTDAPIERPRDGAVTGGAGEAVAVADAGTAVGDPVADATPADGHAVPVDGEPADAAPVGTDPEGTTGTTADDVAASGTAGATAAAGASDAVVRPGHGRPEARATEVASGRGVGLGNHGPGRGWELRATPAASAAAASIPTELAADAAPAATSAEPASVARAAAEVADTAEPVVQVASAEAASGRVIGRDALRGLQQPPSSAVQRVLEVVEQLESMPPPRQLVLDLGDARVRVAIEEGQIRLTLLGERSAAGDALLSDARDELAQRGFDLGGSGSRDGHPDDEPALARPTSSAAARSERAVTTGIRL